MKRPSGARCCFSIVNEARRKSIGPALNCYPTAAGAEGESRLAPRSLRRGRKRGDQHRRRAVIVEEVRQHRAGDLVGVGLAEADALDAHGSTERRELALLVGARYWGPGVFGAALREALVEGRIRRLSRTAFATADSDRVDEEKR